MILASTAMAAAAAATAAMSLPATAASAAPAPVQGEIYGYQYTGKLVMSSAPNTCLTATENENVIVASCGIPPKNGNQVWNLYYTLRYTGQEGVFHGSVSLLLEHKAQYLSIKLGTDNAIVFDTAVIVSFQDLGKNHWLIRTLAGTALSGVPIRYPETEQAHWLKYKTRGTIQTWQPTGGVWQAVELVSGKHTRSGTELASAVSMNASSATCQDFRVWDMHPTTAGLEQMMAASVSAPWKYLGGDVWELYGAVRADGLGGKGVSQDRQYVADDCR